MGTLGLTTTDYSADVAAREEAACLQEVLAGESDLDAQRAEAVSEYERIEKHVRDESAKLQAQLLKAKQAVSQVAVDAIPVEKARDELRNLRQKHRLAFGLPQQVENRSPGVKQTFGHIRSDEERDADGDGKARLMFNRSPMQAPAI